MKKVVNTNEVPHLWANQLQLDARNSAGNLYFIGKVIFSYGSHFPIATISDKDPHTVLFTTQGYSNTTAKHIGKVGSACSHKNIIHCMHPTKADQGDHAENIMDFEQKAKDSCFSLRKANKPAIYLNQIEHELNEFKEYCYFFDLNIDKLQKKYKLVYLFVKSKDGGNEATAKERKAIDAHNKKLAKDKVKAEAKALSDFYDFKRYNIGTINGFSALRFNKGTKRVETSQGVEIPEQIAKRFYKWLQITIKAGGCDGTCTQKILDYTVKSVSPEIAEIGCHKISMTEINGLARELGWVK